jgi:hypothetical protein
VTLRGGPARLVTPALIAVSLGNAAAQALRGLGDWVNTDFVTSFLASAQRLSAGDRNLYDVASLHAFLEQQYHAPIDFPIQYANPPLAAALLEPLTVLAPATALAVFLGVTVAAMAGAVLLLRRGPSTAVVLLAAALSLPAAQTLALGQWSGLLLLAAAGAVVLLERGHEVAGGALLGVLLMKPQLLVLVVPAVIVAGSWRVLLGVAVAGAGWALSAVALIGWQATLDIPGKVLPTESSIAAITVSLPGFASAPFGATAGAIAAACLGVAALTLLWWQRARLRADLPLAIAAGLALSVACTPHALAYDLMLLAVPLTLLARRDAPVALWLCFGIDAAYLADLALPSGLAHVEGLAAAAVAVLALGRSRPGPSSPAPTARVASA